MYKIKEFSKRYLIGFVLSFIICLTAVSAVTYFPSNQTFYDNSNTGMSSTNVQTAIDELYNVCFPPKTGGDAILEDVPVVDSGDGLYKDKYEDRYIYKGKNVNNYITFNNEMWRIVSVESDKTIKIMKDESIGNIAWDSSNSSNWARPATLNTYLNESYLTDTLNTTAQNQIVTKDWNIGGVASDDTDLSSSISDENSKKWNGKVALITVSEYIRSNSNQENCNSVGQVYHSQICGQTTWMLYNVEFWMTLSHGTSSSVYSVESDGTLYGGYASYKAPVRQSVYLSSDIKITEGDGSQNNPYQISL